MRELRHFTDDAEEFIDEVISSSKKHKGDDTAPSGCTYKERCKSLVSSHKNYITQYKDAFDNDSLEDLENTHPNLNQTEKEDLKKLYSYTKKPIERLRNEVLTEDGYENNFCPLCGVNLVNTMDHFIPQTGYPLFVVHPLNLIPSCIICNGKKSDIIKDGDKRKFWNVYLDKPPKESYLVCDVKEGKGGIVDVDFRLVKGKIDDNTFRLLENTMLDKGQNLFDVYRQASGRIISKFINKAVNLIRKVAQAKSLQECLSDLECEINIEFEINDCESVIRKALVCSSVFKKNLKEELVRQGVAFRE